MSRRDAGFEASLAALAGAAAAKGRAALAAKDPVAAIRWLDRAHRLVPSDPNVMLSLATACLDTDPRRAGCLFRAVAEQHDVRYAWLGLAAAMLRCGGPADAAEPLSVALACHALTPDTAGLAGQIARGETGTGWCGVTSRGEVKVHSAGPASVEVRLDGRLVRGTMLPAEWARRRCIEVTVNGRAPLGSPIQIHRIRRTVGFVESWQGGIRGWAWHPGDPDTPVKLKLVWANLDRERVVHAVDEAANIPDNGPLARPRSFCLGREETARGSGPVHVRGPDGRDLLGSPLDPAADEAVDREAAVLLARRYPTRDSKRATGSASVASEHTPMSVDALAPAKPTGLARCRHPVAVVIPVHDAANVTIGCITRVLATVPKFTRIVVVDDGSSDAGLITAMDALARRRRISLLRHDRALGFPASANTGILAATTCDVILLNSDTIPPAGWVDRLRDAAYGAPDIGTVTPFSNNASILSYPGHPGKNPLPDEASVDRMDRLAWRANRGHVVEIPVGVGFCLYLRRDCLDATGLLRADIFAQGYGEENDFCLRARHLGWRHVALPGLFVGHLGGASFSSSAGHLRARNARLLERLHPGYDAMIARFVRDDPLAEARRRIDRLRWRATARNGRGAAILVTHDDGGGVERRVEQAAGRYAADGCRPIVLRPSRTAQGDLAVAVHEGTSNAFPNLIYRMPEELPVLLRLLKAAKPANVEVHHLLGHSSAIQDLVHRLDIPYDVHIHDYAFFCPRLSLVGAYDRYCGEPDLADCEACIADHGHFMTEDVTVEALRDRSATFLDRARSVITPSDDATTRIRRHFPGLSPMTLPHDDDSAIQPAERRPRHAGRLLVCVAGGIGVHKGYNVVLACARDAARRALNMEFVVVGSTIDDERLMATGRIFVTGRFKPEEAVPLIMEQRADIGFVPSIWPETWCLGLGDIWRAGLLAAAFDIGAPAQRIRDTGRGFLLPLGMSPSAINNALVVAARSA